MRFKGLGEMNPIQLRESAMDVSSRRLLQLTISNTYDDAEILDMLLAKKEPKTVVIGLKIMVIKLKLNKTDKNFIYKFLPIFLSLLPK